MCIPDFTSIHPIIFFETFQQKTTNVSLRVAIELKSGDHPNHQDLSSGSHECAKHCVGIYHRISENITCWWHKRESQGITKVSSIHHEDGNPSNSS